MADQSENDLRIHYHEETRRNARIKVIGVGGGGNNAVNRMIAAHVEGVEFIAANTDAQALELSQAPVKLQLGVKLTSGLAPAPTLTSAAAPPLKTPTKSSRPSKARTWSSSPLASAEAPAPELPRSSHRLPAKWAHSHRRCRSHVLSPSKESGACKQADRGMAELLESVDTMIVIPNEKLLAVAKDAGFFESHSAIADDVLRQGVQGISDIITIPGIINRDFADVKTTMAGMGHAVMGTAVRSGAKSRRRGGPSRRWLHLFLKTGAIDGARGILINITGSSTLKLN